MLIWLWHIFLVHFYRLDHLVLYLLFPMFLSSVRFSPTMRFFYKLSPTPFVSDSIQGRSQIHVFFCKVLSHVFLSSAYVFSCAIYVPLFSCFRTCIPRSNYTSSPPIRNGS